MSATILEARELVLLAFGQSKAEAIGQAALKRVLAEHTYTLRGAQVDQLFQAHAERQREVA